MITGLTLKNSIISGANNLSNRRAKVDELNVFPVPDGDTGTNMGMTIGAARAELLNLPDDCTVEKAAQVTASAMLRGARGNSGVISSLLFRGFSKALQGKKTADAEDLVQALEKGVEGAYKAVMKPTEGTMLTVARVASEEAAASGIADAVELWQLVCTAAQRALDNTPEQLPVLKKAGVVDAGGQGLVYIFEGMLSVFKDNHIIAADEAPEKSAKLSTSGAGKGVYTDDLMKVEDIKNGYCTQFLVNKNDGASSNKLRAFLESNGDSVVVIEDDEVINCHVHTADPGKIDLDAGVFKHLGIEIHDLRGNVAGRGIHGAVHGQGVLHHGVQSVLILLAGQIVQRKQHTVQRIAGHLVHGQHHHVGDLAAGQLCDHCIGILAGNGDEFQLDIRIRRFKILLHLLQMFKLRHVPPGVDLQRGGVGRGRGFGAGGRSAAGRSGRRGRRTAAGGQRKHKRQGKNK